MSLAALSPAGGQICVDLRHYGGDKECVGGVVVTVAITFTPEVNFLNFVGGSCCKSWRSGSAR